MSEIFIQKMNGELEPFSMQKLRKSLMKSGVSSSRAREITNEIGAVIHPGDTTRMIYRKAFSMLKKQKDATAARYKLKKAIMELGPSGFPFEEFIGEVFRKQGFLVDVGVFMNGRCVTHEVDVIAAKGNDYYLMECKFHNRQGDSSDVKTALYINARFWDIRDMLKLNPELKEKHHKIWLVTNTHLTTDAIKYGNCAGMKLLSWSYPEGEGLRDIIQRHGIFPVTTLTTLTHHEKQWLLNAGIVLVKNIVQNPAILERAGVKLGRISEVMKEASALCFK